MNRHVFAAALLLLVGTATAADLSKVPRRITKEPAYQTKTPRYVLLAIGPEASDRVWLVIDGDTLYVDRNGNGDLTEAGEKVAAKKGGSAEDGYVFEAGDLSLGGKKHLALRVNAEPLKRWLFGEYARRADLLDALERSPDAIAVSVMLDVEAPKIREKGRVLTFAGPLDADGALLPAARAADAPIIHFAGPLQVTFASNRPELRRNRSKELMLAVGTQGLGAGTLAAIGYDDVIPREVRPVAEVEFPPAKEGGKPIKKRFELAERC